MENSNIEMDEIGFAGEAIEVNEIGFAGEAIDGTQDQ